ncbi:O-antigen ligase [Jeongeupia sp. HS-3]|uniref:O-antigen ligase family protein n=1 Tax=Jeongeupia sp. HS-3 TaxID=1009682 RepID=UPI00191068C6|nr:O-antigen ligase family protein [Jeongeupia sp. HS-3]
MWDKRKIHNGAFMALFSVYFLILSVPHTVALRYLLAGLMLLWGLSNRNLRESTFMLSSSWPARGLLLFTAWIIVQMMFVERSRDVLSEITGQWLPALAAFYFGGMAATSAGDERKALRWLFWLLLIGLLVINGDYFLQIFMNPGKIDLFGSSYPLFDNGQILLSRLMSSKVQISLFSSMGAIFALSVLLSGLNNRSSWKSTGTLGVTVLLVLAILANVFAGARNGMLGIAGSLLSCMAIVLFFNHSLSKKKRLLTAGVMLLVLVGAVFLLYKSDPRWQRVAGSVEMGMHPDKYLAWTDLGKTPYPVLASGEPIEISAFERMAFFSAGVQFSKETPLGVGYSREAFMWQVDKHYGGRPRHAHSGFAEYLTGTGVPGVLIWYGAMLLAVVMAWRSLRRHFDSVGLFCVLLPSGYMARTVVENISRDHMLLLFMAMFGFSICLLMNKKMRPV